MNDIISGLSDYHNWLTSYCQLVVFEYERFMSLEFKHKNLVAPEIIEQCWQYHVLNMEHYYNYCKKKFKNIIPYKPKYFENINDKLLELKKTKEYYYLEYGAIKNSLVWMNNKYDRMIKHDKIKIIFIHINDFQKEYKYTPLPNETILTLCQTTAIKYNIKIKNICIFLSDCMKTVDNFNLEQIYRLNNYNYNDGNGFRNGHPLPSKILLFDLCNNGYNKFHIIII